MTEPRAADEVSIVGAGLVGTVLGMFLSRRGYRVEIYEGRQDPRMSPAPSGRSINLTLAERGWNALRALGIADEIEKFAIPLHGRLIHGDDGGQKLQPYGLKGEAIYSISRSLLHVTLLKMTSKFPNIRLHFNHRCIDADVGERTISFDRPEGGQPLVVRPKRLFAADGAHSTVRRSLLRDPSFRFFQKFSRFQYKELAVPPVNGKLALSGEVLHLWPRGECMLVAFPNTDGSMTCSLFLPAHGPMSFGSINTPEQLREFLRVNAPQLLELMPDVVHDYFSRPPSPLVTTRCAPWVHGGGWLTLLGDSAHSMVPFLGQGLNAGLEDCATLDGLLDTHKGDFDAVLPAFEAARRANCDAVTELAERHYHELAERARDPRFILQKALEQRISKFAPDRFVPLYTMVSFQDTPYLQIAQEAARQERLLAALMELPDVANRWQSPEFDAEITRLLDRGA